jgi:chromosome segregation ATPase
LCGFFVGVIAGSGLSELSSYDGAASALVLEKLLQQAREEQRQAIEACTQVEARLTTARTEQRQIERERDEALRRIRELQTGLDDAVGRLQRLRK